MADWAPFIWALTPTIVVGLAFWFIMRAIIRGDRHERAAYAKLEAEERQRRADARYADSGK